MGHFCRNGLMAQVKAHQIAIGKADNTGYQNSGMQKIQVLIVLPVACIPEYQGTRTGFHIPVACMDWKRRCSPCETAGTGNP